MYWTIDFKMSSLFIVSTCWAMEFHSCGFYLSRSLSYRRYNLRGAYFIHYPYYNDAFLWTKYWLELCTNCYNIPIWNKYAKGSATCSHHEEQLIACRVSQFPLSCIQYIDIQYIDLHPVVAVWMLSLLNWKRREEIQRSLV